MTFHHCRALAAQEVRETLPRLALAGFLYLAKWRWTAICWFLLCGFFEFLILYPAAAVWSVGTVLFRLVARLDPRAGKRWSRGL